MDKEGRTIAAGLALAWMVGMGMLWPQTAMSGYAGQQTRMESSIHAISSALPRLDDACRRAVQGLASARARIEVARGLPTVLGLHSGFGEAESAYAAADCPSGAYLASLAMARDVGRNARAAAGLERGDALGEDF